MRKRQYVWPDKYCYRCKFRGNCIVFDHLHTAVSRFCWVSKRIKTAPLLYDDIMSKILGTFQEDCTLFTERE